MYFYSDNSSDLGRGINPPLVCPGVSDLMSNFITARSTSPLSDPSGREARVTSAFESPLSDLNGREASLIAEQKSPLSDPNGREASLIAERKRPLSEPNGREASLIAEPKNPLSAKHSSHCREVSLTAATQCFQINMNISKTEINTKKYQKNTKTKTTKKNEKNINLKKIAKYSSSENTRRIIENNKNKNKSTFQNKKTKNIYKKKIIQRPKLDQKFHKLNTGQKIQAKNAKIIKNAKTKKKNLSRKQNIKKSKCLKCEMDKKKCMCNEIEKIDNTVMSWRFAMCISCACKCKGESFDDLYESSNSCNEQCHSIIYPTTSLHITGKLSAAVAYINACRMYFLKHYMDARYYLEEAILKSCARENKVNAFVSSISTVLLSKINEMGDISKIQFPSILTLSEILATSENYTFQNKKCSKYKRPIGNDMNTLVIMQNKKDT